MSIDSKQDFRIGQYTLAKVRFSNINLTTVKNNSTLPSTLPAFPQLLPEGPFQGQLTNTLHKAAHSTSAKQSSFFPWAPT